MSASHRRTSHEHVPAPSAIIRCGAVSGRACAWRLRKLLTRWRLDGGQCASPRLRSGHETVAVRTSEQAEAMSLRVKALLRKPLTADRAAHIALLNNRDLQAAYNALGLSEAAMVQASLPPNPTFSLERIAGAGAVEIEGRIVGQPACSSRPCRHAPKSRPNASDRRNSGGMRKRCASRAKRGARSSAPLRRARLSRHSHQARETGKTAAELAKRLGETGAMNKLDQARNQAFHAEMVAQLGTARLRAASERERLVRALGLWGDDLDFRLPAQLPQLPRACAALRSHRNRSRAAAGRSADGADRGGACSPSPTA